MVHFIRPVMTERLFSLPLTKVDIHFVHVRIYATPYHISWIIFILGLEPSYIEKMLESRRVQTAPLSWLIYFYTATKEISWILCSMTIKLIMSRLLIRLQIYPPELQLNKANTTDHEAPPFKSNLLAQKIHACKYTPVCKHTPVCKSTCE